MKESTSGVMGLKKYIVLTFMLSCMGCSKVDISREVPLNVTYQLSDQHSKFEAEKNKSNILFCVGGSAVMSGILFKIGAIFSGVWSGCILARKYRKMKKRKNRDSGEKTARQIEQKRYHDYIKTVKKREKRRKRDG